MSIQTEQMLTLPGLLMPKRRFLLRIINFWPPFFGAGIRVTRITPDMRAIDVEMKLRFWNSNYVGTQFGGSLYAMTDPFPMLMLIENLGRDYIVWDKAACIRFRRPGKGKVKTEFRITEEQLDDIRQQLKVQQKIEPRFVVEVKDASGAVVAEVEKVIYIRRKQEPPSAISRQPSAKPTRMSALEPDTDRPRPNAAQKHSTN